MPSHITQNLNANETALCGGIAGATARVVIAPLDVVKIRLQVQNQPYSLGSMLSRPSTMTSGVKYTGMWQAFRVIATEEGVRGLFKGNMSAEYLYLSYGITQFYAYHHLDTLLDKFQMSSMIRVFVSGMLAGSIATTITYPFDLLRTRFAMQGSEKTLYHSVSHALHHIYHSEGLSGLYRGLMPSITQIMPYMGLTFLSYDMLRSGVQWLKDHHYTSNRYDVFHDMACGSLASIISKTGVFPLDVIRKRLQLQGPHRTDYVVTSIPCYARRSIFGCAKAIARTEGFLALYKGLAPGLLKVGPAGAVNFLVFEWAKASCQRIKESGLPTISENTLCIT
ncbi:mitochondrial carrier domain-containing protein [Radiomyces spectabilis]|uniref:mitochondrial carrier domain-containing protein n=1 Tax=Radiomyces spectabilis TaxID=64574 RepID=UPI0022210749|nr:mitochondrial carrier domain-containing protein [Radiomyces spectabilis]KAI8369321.1 mitochondrial carrier domain-containing protein [Radiomyces spectabilis]